MTTHSWFSPSAAAANIACPARAKLNVDKDNSSVYADQGTFCHKAVEQYDNGKALPIKYDEDWMHKAIKDAINQRNALMERMGFVTPDASFHREYKVDLSNCGRPDVFGTVDLIAHKDDHLVIVDYKFGAGVPVSPENNAQLMTYALGASGQFAAKKFTLVVIQPRLHKEALTWDTDIATLDYWWETVLEPAIKAAEQPEPLFNPGEDQCRWCNAAKEGCPAQIQQLMDLLPDPTNPEETLNVDGITNEELSQQLKKIAAYEQAISQLRSTAFNRLMEGQQIEGFKLVKSLKHKKWNDPDKVSNYLQRKGLKMDERYKMTLVSPAQAEKLLAAKGVLTPKGVATLEKYVTIPEGDPTLAPISSKRPDYTPPNLMDELPVTIDDIM